MIMRSYIEYLYKSNNTLINFVNDICMNTGTLASSFKW